ncbi:MAG: filamentous hemagglutinin N-terminal domain-containing protein [Scytonematopsis contorta HA4267-MV1]|jgi:filamentous hemagglutinin family protein|nr:filamentous hemagglutinin N-terminal domain-containing protein [Scytonematopsis contorta HA4267-MV1]
MEFPYQRYQMSLLVLFVLLFPSTAYSQIVPDSTVGTKLMQNVLTNGDRIDGGLIRNNNLFHSFQEFNINAGRSVYFTNPTDITNIFTRVTGVNPSNINGKLGVLGNANLFFMNPNGIVFGKEASLDIKGSFLGTTASSINFADGTQFSVGNTQVNPVLTVSVPVGLGFGSNPGNITVTGIGHKGTERPQGTTTVFIPEYPNVKPQLQLQPGKTLGLIASGVKLDGGTVSVPDGRMEIGSVGGNQTVPLSMTNSGFALDYSAIQNFQDIGLVKAAADVSGNNGGSLQVHGRHISLTQGSEMLAHTLGTNGVGQGINIRASESLDVAAINSRTSISTIMTSVRPLASGKGGDINIDAPNFRLAYGANLRSELYGKGQAGNVTFRTKNFEMLGVNASGEQGAVTVLSMGLIGRNASGSGGTLTVEADKIRIANGARMRSDLSLGASGKLGDINIKATEMDISGIVTEGRSFFNSWISSSIESNTNGQAGNVNIEVQKARFADGGSIRLDTLAAGKGGNLNFRAEDIEIKGVNEISGRRSRLSARAGSSNKNDTIQGGLITINTQRLRVNSGGQIDLSTAESNSGTSGDLIINASELVEINGAYYPKTGGNILVSTLQAIVDRTGTGKGGNITLQTPQLRITDGGEISAAVLGNGTPGNINIKAGNVEVSGKTANGLLPSQITAASNSAIPNTKDFTASITIQANQLNVKNGAEISVSNQQLGKAGNLNITSDIVRLDNGGSLRADVKSGSEGNITLNTDILLMRSNSQITTNAGTNSNGGNITINAGAFAQLERSKVTANAGVRGGSITINTQGFFQSPDSSITATGSISNGEVKIITPDIKQDNALQEQATNFVDTGAVVASTCLAQRNAQKGRFVVTGNGGLPESPNDKFELPYELVQVQPVNSLNSIIPTNQTSGSTRVWKIGDPIVEAQNLKVINGRVLLTAADSGNSVSSASNLTCEK